MPDNTDDQGKVVGTEPRTEFERRLAVVLDDFAEKKFTQSEAILKIKEALGREIDLDQFHKLMNEYWNSNYSSPLGPVIPANRDQ